MSSLAQFGAAFAIVAIAILPQLLAAYLSDSGACESEQY